MGRSGGGKRGCGRRDNFVVFASREVCRGREESREKETISYRDLEVLDFICRFGVVNRIAVQWWADTGRSVTLDRERRLREAGLIEVHPRSDEVAR